MQPFGAPQIIDAVAGAESVLDIGCGSARLTLGLARAGATEVVGIDTNAERLAQGRERLAQDPDGERVTLAEGDFNRPFAFGDGCFAASVSRLALMAAANPVATLREQRRVTVTGGPIATATWAPVAENPWMGLPRAAVAATLGAGPASYAGAFGRIGDPEDLAAAHRAAGLDEVRAETLLETLEVADVAALWAWLIEGNGHVRRLDADIGDGERAAVLAELDRLVAGYRDADGTLRLPRTMTLVTAVA